MWSEQSYENTVLPVLIFFSAVTMSLWLLSLELSSPFISPRWTRGHHCFLRGGLQVTAPMALNSLLVLLALFLDTCPRIERSAFLYSKGAHCEFMSTVLCPLTLRPCPAPFPRQSFLLYLSASSVFISSWFWTSLMSSVLHYPFFSFPSRSSGFCLLFLNFLQPWGGKWRKEKDKSPPVVGVKKKKQLFMTRGEDRLTSGCWSGWVLGTGRNFPVSLKWKKGS